MTKAMVCAALMASLLGCGGGGDDDVAGDGGTTPDSGVTRDGSVTVDAATGGTAPFVRGSFTCAGGAPIVSYDCKSNMGFQPNPNRSGGTTWVWGCNAVGTTITGGKTAGASFNSNFMTGTFMATSGASSSVIWTPSSPVTGGGGTTFSFGQNPCGNNSTVTVPGMFTTYNLTLTASSATRLTGSLTASGAAGSGSLEFDLINCSLGAGPCP